MSETPREQARTFLRPGDLVDGRYRIEEVLGGGGMAFVYRASHAVLEQPVAIKVVAPQIRALPGIADRFVREARAATKLKGEHVVRVFDVGTSDGSPYMVMELLEGRDLGALLESDGPVPVPAAIDYVLQTCEALAEVHGLGIVHRDLKPANLFLTRGADGRPCVKLIDFGISRLRSSVSSTTNPGATMGSPRYMSPEQMESASKADERSDIWGVGAVLYELLTGRTPYDGEGFLDFYLAAMQGPPPPPSRLRKSVPSALDAVVARCLRVDPSERWPDVAALAAALAPFGDEGAEERTASIARVLAASHRRLFAVPVVDADPAAPALRSRVQKRVTTRIDDESRARTLTWLALAAVVLGAATVGARVLGTEAPATAPPPPPAVVPEEEAPPRAEPAPTPTHAPLPPPPPARRDPAPPPREVPEEMAPAEPPPTVEAPPPPSPDQLFEDRK